MDKLNALNINLERTNELCRAVPYIKYRNYNNKNEQKSKYYINIQYPYFIFLNMKQSFIFVFNNGNVYNQSPPHTPG